MPKFSEIERYNIQQKLLEEGERLFTAYGLKKVTIEDLVVAVNIAKASFYKFYEGKEFLYLDIVQKNQLEIFNQLEMLLENNLELSSRQRVNQTFTRMSELLLQYPILSKIDSITMDIISRKISKERLKKFNEQNIDAVATMEKHGISFVYNKEIVSYTFQSLYSAWIGLQDKEVAIQKTVIDIMLNGIIEQVVAM